MDALLQRLRAALTGRYEVEQELGRGGALRLTLVLDGGVQRSGARVRVTLRLVRTADGVAEWAGIFDADSGDVVAGARNTGTAAAAAGCSMLAPKGTVR
jgi:TolB-like protein